MTDHVVGKLGLKSRQDINIVNLIKEQIFKLEAKDEEEKSI